MIYNSNSSAIKNIKIEDNDNKVIVTWTSSDKEYTYELPDLTNFTMKLNEVIDTKQSLGSFINKSIHNGDLKLLTV